MKRTKRLKVDEKREFPRVDTMNGVVRVWDEKSQKWIPDCYPIPMPELIDSLRGVKRLVEVDNLPA